MAEALTVPTGPPNEPALDYEWLRTLGIELVQQLAGDIWTDYNEHDPGVTTLEQLCYVLTDLAYRAEFKLADLLTGKPGGRIDPRRQALFPARRIFPCNPVTIDDYRKLIADRVPAVANVWLTPCRPADVGGINGLYDIAIYAPDVDPCGCEPDDDPAQIAAAVRRVYCRHRALGEDVHAVTVLEKLPVVITATITINGTHPPEALLASLFFRLGMLLAPELGRRSLETLYDAGRPPADIFDGPLLRRGFVDDTQLKPKASLIALSSIVETVAKTPGVVDMTGLDVTVDGEHYSGDDVVPVSPDRILAIDSKARHGAFTIQLVQDGCRYQPDPARVARQLDRLWGNQRRTFPLTVQYRRLFPYPRGTYRDVTRYYSVQEQFPNVYGINTYGLPADSTDARRGQAKQFKAYLLFFEQLMADYLSQLGQVSTLFSTEDDVPQTYFWQSLAPSVPNVAPLLGEGYEAGLATIVAGTDPTLDRRQRFLDLLLALYGEKLDASMLVDADGQCCQSADTGKRLLRAKLAMLHNLIAMTRDRGRGIDYLARPSRRNIAGMAIECRIRLGMPALPGAPLLDGLAELGIALVDEDAAGFGVPLSEAASAHIAENFTALGPFAAMQPPPTADQPPPIDGVLAVTDDFLRAARNLDAYWIGSMPGDRAISIVCRAVDTDRWHFVGKFSALDRALALVRYLVALAEAFFERTQQLYIVDHVLLRPADAVSEPDSSRFGYSFTLTAVLCPTPDLMADRNYREQVQAIVRATAPAHIVTRTCFLTRRAMRDFETLYGVWRHALRHAELQTAHAARRVVRFLDRHQHDHPPPLDEPS